MWFQESPEGGALFERARPGRSMDVMMDRRNGSSTSVMTRRISEQLARRLGERKFDMWFGPSTRMRIEGRRLEVTAESQYVADWIGANFSNELREIARNALGDAAEVAVAVDENASARPVSAVPTAAPRNGRSNGHANGRGRSSRRPDLHLPLRHRFDDFVVGRSNELAYTSAVRIADPPAGESFGPLFIYGECGLGKTHLLQATCRRALERAPGANVRYTTGEQFTNEYIAALKSNSLEAFRRKIRGLDLLAIDDIHFLSNKTATQTEFLHTLDAIDLVGARVVMASDEHPRHLRSVNRALVSRFLAGMVVEIERPDREMRIEIVKRLATARGLNLNEGAIEMIAANCVGSIREVEGALTKLAAMRLLSADQADGDVGCVMVERLFKTRSQQGRPLRITSIIDAVCNRLCVEKSDLLSTTRHRRVVIARGLVSFLARDLTTLSFPEIGRALGRRNHSTVLTAARRLGDQVEANESIMLDDGGESVLLRELVDQLRHEIRREARL